MSLHRTFEGSLNPKYLRKIEKVSLNFLIKVIINKDGLTKERGMNILISICY